MARNYNLKTTKGLSTWYRVMLNTSSNNQGCSTLELATDISGEPYCGQIWHAIKIEKLHTIRSILPEFCFRRKLWNKTSNNVKMSHFKNFSTKHLIVLNLETFCVDVFLNSALLFHLHLIHNLKSRSTWTIFKKISFSEQVWIFLFSFGLGTKLHFKILCETELMSLVQLDSADLRIRLFLWSNGFYMDWHHATLHKKSSRILHSY